MIISQQLRKRSCFFVLKPQMSLPILNLCPCHAWRSNL